MKSFKTLLIGAVAFVTVAAEAANFTVSSFLSPQVSSLVISNNVGWTNLNNISQNISQGLYQLGTNTAGTSINAPIATNTLTMNWLIYTNSTPVQWFGQTYPGSMVVYTNSTTPLASTNDIIYVTPTTNNAINVFQDVPLPQDFFNGLVTDNGQPGAAGQTISIGYIQFVTSQFTLTGYAVGAGSNIVNAIFSPIAATPSNSGLPNYGIPGFTPGMEPNFNDKTWTVTFTNQISTIGAPTVYNIPVPRWVFPGARAMRLRSLFASGGSTNATAVQSITYQNWTP